MSLLALVVLRRVLGFCADQSFSLWSFKTRLEDGKGDLTGHCDCVKLMNRRYRAELCCWNSNNIEMSLKRSLS